jgi:hypothetical protein
MTGEPWEGADAQWEPERYRWGSADDLRDWRLQRLGALRERGMNLTGLWFVCGVGVVVGAIWVEGGSEDWRGVLFGLLAAGVISVPFAVGLSLLERAQKRLRAQLEAE